MEKCRTPDYLTKGSSPAVANVSVLGQDIVSLLLYSHLSNNTAANLVFNYTQRRLTKKQFDDHTIYQSDKIWNGYVLTFKMKPPSFCLIVHFWSPTDWIVYFDTLLFPWNTHVLTKKLFSYILENTNRNVHQRSSIPVHKCFIYALQMLYFSTFKMIATSSLAQHRLQPEKKKKKKKKKKSLTWENNKCQVFIKRFSNIDL